MAVFQSKYRELSFYVDGERHAFSSGTLSTDDVEVIAVLDTMADAKRIDQPKTASPKVESPEGTETKTEDKPPTRRKTSGK
ncbi:hypothetical protein [Paenibacillus sp. DMB20]|uniref:hypothetical protein n=1 Tax=Paenibacillus sp. DMB20 TaxID=1642570 RepID=UPI000627C44D|nr:hypothetical protein [Paenibacillus sp. DMB20]KKO54505.1 hypothetical protein XI25_06900 [Paenibacillus sp. DMB20]